MTERKLPRAAEVRRRCESRKLGRGHRHDRPVLGAWPRGEGPWDSWNSCSPQRVFISKDCLRPCTNIQDNLKDRQKPYFQAKGMEATMIFLLLWMKHKIPMSLAEWIYRESRFYMLSFLKYTTNTSSRRHWFLWATVFSSIEWWKWYSVGGKS